MKLLAIPALLVSALCFAQTSDWQWARRVNYDYNIDDYLHRINHEQDAGCAVATGSDGSIVVCGSFIDSVTMDGITLYAQPRILASLPQWDLFLAKFSRNGMLLWATTFGCEEADTCTAITIDGANTIYLGLSCAAFNFRAGDVTRLKGSGAMAKFSGDGAFQWVIDADEVIEDLSARGVDVFAAGQDDGLWFAAKVDPVGSFAWKTPIIPYIPDYTMPGYYLFLQQGKLTVAASVDGGCFIAKGDSILQLSSQGMLEHSWGIEGGMFCDIAVTATSIFTAGVFRNEIIAAGLALEARDSLSTTMFTAAYSLNGKLESLHVSTGAASSALSVCADSSGGCYVVGYYILDVRLDDKIVARTDTTYCGYLLHLGPDHFTEQLESPGSDRYAFFGVEATAGNQALVSGYFYTTVDFSCGPIEAKSGWPDPMIAVFGPETAAVAIQEDPAISIYPLPASYLLNIERPFALDGIVEVVDAVGRRIPVRSLTSDETSITLDVSHLPSGIYRLLLRSNSVTTSKGFSVVH